MGWSRSITQADGSASEVETFAGVTVPLPGATLTSTGKVFTWRDGVSTYVRDQADKWRMSTSNALGQMVSVTEDPTASFGGYSHTGTNLVTNYSYDTLSNLTHVGQNGQSRDFIYSTVGRLLSASNPESGTITYKYDPNGNLTSKTDARLTTNYTYDQLNRPVTRTYTDGTTPAVTYTYYSGSVSPNNGNLASVSNTVSTTTYTGYDVLGRVTGSQQTTDAQTYAMTYQYNLAGQLTQEMYPSGRIVHHNYAPDGKLAAVSSRLAVNKPAKSYARNFSYNAAGAVTGLQLGNMRWESTIFNSRMQPTQIALGTTQTGVNATDMLQLNYAYDDGTNLDRNNGNVISQKITVLNVGATPGFVANQSYTYDELNRLKSATEMSTPNNSSTASESWKQTYLYDRFGNRTFDTANYNTTTLPVNFNAAVYNPTISTANNQFNTQQGYLYDAVGNVTQDAEGRKFVYDGENKQTSFGVGGSTDNGGKYRYDGRGRRVRKEVAGEVTIFVYNAAGQLMAEYATVLATSPQIIFLTADALGTPRISTEATGTIAGRHDYMPFGEDTVPFGNRSIALNYGPDSVREKFTGKERDDESRLDYFGARYYAASFGRFTSPDSLLSSGTIYDPGTWNRFAYVSNNPLRFIDPTGLYKWDASLGGSLSDAELKKRKGGQKIVDRRDEFRNALKQAGNAMVSGKLSNAQMNQVNDALKAYGSEGSGNGVYVASGAVAGNDAAITEFGNDAGYDVDSTTGEITPNIKVTFDEDKNIDAQTAAHEGSHVNDRLNLVKTLTLTMSNEEWAATPQNITRYATENTAYHVGAAVAKGLGVETYNASGHEYWRRGWTDAEVDSHINIVLDKLYKVTADAPGQRLIEIKQKGSSK